MNSLRQYIVEKFQVSKDYKRQYTYHPKDKDDLMQCIQEKIEQYGLGTKNKPLNLNDIDTSEITDMSYIFSALSNAYFRTLSKKGYFDISDWDVSNVEDMRGMFAYSGFNGDISDWDVSNVKDMSWLFNTADFDNDISDWNVSKVEYMSHMFYFSQFTGKNGKIDNWDIRNVKNMENIFTACALQNNPPKWYKK